MTDKQLIIIEAAERLFFTNGFDGTSIRDIAKEADVNVAMISYYFGSKEKLLENIFQLKMQHFYSSMQAEDLFKPTYTAFESLEKLVHTYLNTMNVNPHFYQFLAVEGRIKKRLLSSDAFQAFKSFNLDLVARAVQKGVDEKVFQAVDPVLVYATMAGIFMNFQMNQNFLRQNLQLGSDEDYQSYINNQLIHFIHRTLKALLTYED